MRIHFVDGPWDGVVFETTIAPEQITFGDSLTEAECDEKDPMLMTFKIDVREWWQYLRQGRKLKDGVVLKVGENLPHEPDEGEDPLDLVSEDLLDWTYCFAPGKKVWWEK